MLYILHQDSYRIKIINQSGGTESKEVYSREEKKTGFQGDGKIESLTPPVLGL